MISVSPISSLFPYTTLFRSLLVVAEFGELLLQRDAVVAWQLRCLRGPRRLERFSALHQVGEMADRECVDVGVVVLDRKSTRLNSSHSQISYAVFCLKKKNRR